MPRATTVYDRLNWPLAAVDALGYRSSASYDAMQNVLSRTHPDGNSGYFTDNPVNLVNYQATYDTTLHS
jgi:YD repeat-containing protein